MWAWLAVLYIVSVTVQLSLGLRLRSPWIMVDELVYSDMARSFAATGHFLIRGEHGNYGPVYPLLLSPAYALFGSMSEVYRWARVIDAVAMSSAVLPAYLLARRVVRAPAALVAAALAIAVPSMAYVGTLMTENVFYPIFLWLAFALVCMLERPTLRRQLVLLGLCVLAFLTRAQAVALVGAVLTAPLALAWIERGRPRRLAPFKTLYGIVGAGAVLVAAVEVARGRSPLAVLGNYSKTSHGSYGLWPAIHWVLLHVAELDLYLWFLPFAAFIVLVANARHLDRPLRVFCAAAISLSVWLVLEVGVFASQYSHRIEERNLFYLAPLFIVALLAWIERGQPRPPRAALVAAGLAAALPGAIPFLSLLDITAQSDTLGVQPWWFLGDAWAGRDSVSLVVVLTAVACAAAFLWLPRRWAPVLPAAVALGFLFTWLPLELWTHGFPQLSRSVYAQGIGVDDPSWIDARVGSNAHVAVLWSGGNELAVWQNEFWNRSLDRVYDLGTALPGDMPSTPVTVQRSTGILHDAAGRTIASPYVLTSDSVELVGTKIATDPAKQLVLYRVASPARTTTRITGIYPGPSPPWSSAHVTWTRLRCTGGALVLDLSSDTQLFKGTTQRAEITGTAVSQAITFPAGISRRHVRLPLTPRGGECRVDLAISPVRRPVDYPRLEPGNSDPRLLGLHFDSIRYVPPK
jgi:hypothetical protein